MAIEATDVTLDLGVRKLLRTTQGGMSIASTEAVDGLTIVSKIMSA